MEKTKGIQELTPKTVKAMQMKMIHSDPTVTMTKPSPSSTTFPVMTIENEGQPGQRKDDSMPRHLGFHYGQTVAGAASEVEEEVEGSAASEAPEDVEAPERVMATPEEDFVVASEVDVVDGNLQISSTGKTTKLLPSLQGD